MTLDGAGIHVMHATGATNKQREQSCKQGSQSSQKMKNIFAARLEGRVSTLRTRGTTCLCLSETPNSLPVTSQVKKLLECPKI